MNLNDLELSHGTCSACGRVDLLVQCSVGDYCCNACLKDSIEKPDTGDKELDAVLLALGVLGKRMYKTDPAGLHLVGNVYGLFAEYLRKREKSNQ